MPRPLVLSFLAALAFAQPPATRVEPVTDVVHGRKIVDPYRWLEDQDSPEVRAWINAQMAYTRAFLDKIPGRDALARRIEPLLRTDSLSAPIKRSAHTFVSRRAKTQDYPVLSLLNPDGSETPLIDFNRFDSDPDVTGSVMSYGITGRLLAVASKKGGEDEVSIRFFDVEKRSWRGFTLPRARYMGVHVAPGDNGVYYGTGPGYNQGIYYRAFDAPAPVLLFNEGLGPKQLASANLSRDGRWLLINVAHGVPAERTDIYLKDLAHDGPVIPVIHGVNAEFAAVIPKGAPFMFVKTNWNAKNGRIFTIDLASPADRSRWRDAVPETGSPIRAWSAAAGRLYVSYLENVVSRIRVFSPAGKPLGEVKLPGIGSAFPPSGDWDDNTLYYSFTSFTEPGATFRYDARTGRQTLYHRPALGVDTSQLESRQVWFTSRDGVRVPMFLVHKKGLQLDGNRPVYLTGYGGFNLSQTPSFNDTAVLWASLGGVFALPNLRGGGEFGEKWHEAGMFERKQNVFDDFIAAAEWLIASKYSNPSKIAIAGGSNGGLLVGAVITQRPELFGAAICGVPLLDMVRYHLFKVARWWTTEYGSSEDPKMFPHILAYSPYHNVKKGVKYPAVLFMSGDSDTRVDPLHARKMAALLQASTGSGKPVLLHYETSSGHSNVQTIAKRVATAVDRLSFLLKELDVPIPE
jgi:prolyl oligopeptidase